jgi:hypothetical protein
MRLIDSDVIIWNWRSRKAAATLLAAEPFAFFSGDLHGTCARHAQRARTEEPAG